jgi:hypothetical protein
MGDSEGKGASAYLQRRAERCRRLAIMTHSAPIAAALRALAEAFERKAAQTVVADQPPAQVAS